MIVEAAVQQIEIHVMANTHDKALELAAQALFELERINHSQALLLVLAALRASRPRSRRGVAATVSPQVAISPPLLVSRALRRCLAEMVPWRHLWGHHGELYALAWSPDGRWILALDHRFLSVWDTATMQLTRQFVLRSGHPVPSLELVHHIPGESMLDLQNRLGIAGFARENMVAQLSWHPGGQSFLLVWPGDFAGIYDAVTGALQEFHPSPSRRFRAIRWHTGEPQLLTIDDDQHVAYVWDWTKETSRQFDHAAYAALSPDGMALVVSGLDGSVRLWSVPNGRLLHQFADGGSALSALAWHPDGQQIVAGRMDGSVPVWDVVTGTLSHILRGHASAVAQAAWSPDGRYLLTGDERLVHCWDTTTWASVSTFLYRRETAKTYRALEWNPDSRHVLGSSGFSWSLWHAPSGQLHCTVAWHRFSRSVWDPTGRMIVTYGDDMNCLIWQTSVRQPQRHTAAQLALTSVQITNDTTVFGLAQDTAGVLQLRELSTNRLVWQLSCPGPVSHAVVSPDGTMVFTIHVEDLRNIPLLWNTASGTLATDLSAHVSTKSYQCRAVWHPTEAVFALQADDQPILICDARSGQVIVRLADATWAGPRDGNDIWAGPPMAWSSAGDQLLAASASGTRVWNWHTGDVLHASEAFWRDERQCAVGWGIDGPLLLTWNDTGRVTMWNAWAGELAQILEGRVTGLRAAAWSPSRRKIVAADDRVVWIWDSQTGQALQLLEGHNDTIASVAWMRDEQRIVTCDYQGVVRVWIVAAELLESELIRRIGESQVESSVFDPNQADSAIRQTVPSWQGWRREQAAIAANVQKYDELSRSVTDDSQESHAQF